MGYTEPPHKDRKGKLKSEIVMSYFSILLGLPHIWHTCIHNYTHKHQDPGTLGPWDPASSRSRIWNTWSTSWSTTVFTRPLEVTMTESDGKIWISHGFLWENEMAMVGKPGWGLWYVPYKGIPYTQVHKPLLGMVYDWVYHMIQTSLVLESFSHCYQGTPIFSFGDGIVNAVHIFVKLIYLKIVFV